jgi:hypothetical protein
MIDLTWLELKSMLNSSTVDFKYIDTSNRYEIYAYDAGFSSRTIIHKSNTADITDFEANYKPIGNKKIGNKQSPFATKQLSNGNRLFRRVHGVKAALSGDTTVSLVIPYDYCKINSLEIVWAPAGLRADLKVYDTPSGTISTIPNYMLNQFGFESGVAKDYYSETSEYDADLIKDMKVEVTLKNPDNLTGDVCVNFILHELKV